MTIRYFAYGSNMVSNRLLERVPSGFAIGRAILNDWCVLFNKLSKDGSGKANLIPKINFVTWGSLYEMSKIDIKKLDVIEKGYQRMTVKVINDDGEEIDAETYYSDKLIDNPVALDSYKQIVISGAIENNLPAEYIQYLHQLPSEPDNKC